MKALTLTLPLAAAFLLSACASTPKVQTDSASGINYSSYKTYYWLSKPDKGVPPLVSQRIVENVDAQMRAKGLTLASTGDIAVAAHVATKEQQSLDTMYMGGGLGGWGWRFGGGMGSATTTVQTYEEGTLIVDLFDAKTKQAIWRGSASGTVPSSPEKVTAAVQAGVQNMFLQYPPGTKAK